MIISWEPLYKSATVAHMSIQHTPWPFSERTIVLTARLVSDPISTMTIVHGEPASSRTVRNGPPTRADERRVLAAVPRPQPRNGRGRGRPRGRDDGPAPLQRLRGEAGHALGERRARHRVAGAEMQRR